MDLSAPARPRLARICHALSDETRLRILGLLRRGERCVCELTTALGIGQSRLSFHLKVLKDAGLVEDRREGRWVYYTLIPEVLDAAAEDLRNLRPVFGPRAEDLCCR
jgi:ArsR family transcriptional regulator